MVDETDGELARLRRKDHRARAGSRDHLPDGSALQHGDLQGDEGQGKLTAPVADWKTKRRWVDDAFAALEKAGYTSPAPTPRSRRPKKTKFLYRDMLWTGADLIGLGVASFSHVGGTHFQNQHDLDPYLDAIKRGELPLISRPDADPEERMIREFILQMKLGHVDSAYFQRKFGVDVRETIRRASPAI